MRTLVSTDVPPPVLPAPGTPAPPAVPGLAPRPNGPLRLDIESPAPVAWTAPAPPVPPLRRDSEDEPPGCVRAPGMRSPPCRPLSELELVVTPAPGAIWLERSEEHTSELQSRGLISYAVFCLKKKNHHPPRPHPALRAFSHARTTPPHHH